MLSTKVREPVPEGNEDTGSDFVLLVLHKIMRVRMDAMMFEEYL